jgi:hypothetical protein
LNQTAQLYLSQVRGRRIIYEILFLLRQLSAGRRFALSAAIGLAGESGPAQQ